MVTTQSLQQRMNASNRIDLSSCQIVSSKQSTLLVELNICKELARLTVPLSSLDSLC